ncbi:NAD(P)H-dependent glycerol-3-phosphate dehydrogenase [Phycisphaera mikurensis]|uniref:Glycerol-3-phosphate dehydrogenase [NAD(P)+] n=1 Tax=Phycisphaera mikurensis (strain NBRC 102666 / KCTC 22515 / FYK2301M01) TaxID=1142394 RepID=I0IGK3_PHYMF|nr:NAD(P)H-dependent glycerol-3-phosphate dehydrogenase [Phycisphaera mikurensis]MBB6442927.1 glycerol-3-phosphate dehydrogenase (NAD(P)+) [Phycisphaera mikurensis]BAM04391.1 NAD(P)H-dependent glycerol-3-phosphate dehydrogenase [Phycisphaera mikurensis NBRC 102666]
MSGFQRVAVIGSGAMATVMASLLVDNGRAATLWGRDAGQIDLMRRHRENHKYLPGHPLPAALALATDPVEALDGCDLVLASIPTQQIRSVFGTFAPLVPAGVPVVSVAKGIERETLLSPTGVLADTLGGPDARAYASLSGPTIAEELARKLPATAAAACRDAKVAAGLQAAFHADWFRVYTNPDLLGVELAGALKNVVAIAAGIIDGLGLGANAKSALLARGLAEISRLGVAMGASAETFAGLTGVGDLATTCFSPSGRNRSCGEALGRGQSLDGVIAGSHGVVEGVPTCRAARVLAARHGVDMPITGAVHAVLFEGLSPRDGVARLMTREARPESEQQR